MLKGVDGTAFTCGVRQVEGVTFGFSLGVRNIEVEKP